MTTATANRRPSKVVVLDLNGTLIKRLKQGDIALKEQLNRVNRPPDYFKWYNKRTHLTTWEKYDANIYGWKLANSVPCLYFRPHLEEFAQFLNTNKFEYLFWTTMPSENCRPIMEMLKSKGLRPTRETLSQEDCVENPLASSYFTKNRKDLTMLSKRLNVSIDSLLLIDDSDEKLYPREAENFRENFLEVQDYNPLNRDDAELCRIIGELKKYV